MINEFIELSERKKGALMIEQETRGKSVNNFKFYRRIYIHKPY